MENINIYGTNIPTIIYYPLVYVLWVGMFLVIKQIGFTVLRRLAKKTVTRIDDAFITAANLPLTLLIFTSGGAMVEKLMPPVADESLLNHPFLLGFKAMMIIAIVLFLDRFAIQLLKIYSDRIEILKTSGSITQGVAHTVFFGLGFLVLLDSCGISVTPVIASLGIGSLAVALALQPTLENLFSGVQIVTDNPIQVGQYVKLESGEEGHVLKIGWRSTWICMPSNNVVVIPNKTLVNSRIMNYHYPETEQVVAVPVGVHYKSDLDHVERVTIEVGREVMREVNGGVKDFEPVVRYAAFGDFCINFNAVLRAREFSAIGAIKHEFIKRLLKRYAQENIIIPYPVQAVNVSQERAAGEEMNLQEYKKV